jgi:imidazolonepropionase-like amidohydrolase
MRYAYLVGAAALLLAICCAPCVSAESPVALVGARILPIEGPEIADGTLLIEGKRIVAVGPRNEVDVPSGAKVIALEGKLIMPGLVCTHSHIGISGGADGSSPIQPGVRIYDSINVQDAGFKRAVAGGLTTLNIMPGSGHLISGQTAYVKLRLYDDGPRTVEQLFMLDDDGRPMGGLKMANGTNSMRDPPFPGTRGKSAFLVREAFLKAREYQAGIERAAGDPAKMPARDLNLEPLVEAMQGKRMVHHHTHRHDDIITVLRLSKEFGFRVVLHHVSEAWRVAEEIAAADAPCSIILVDSPGGKLEARYLLLDNGHALEQAGVRTAFHTDDYITDSRVFTRMAGLAVRAGMSREKALEGLTLAGARMLDLEQRIGSLRAGKDADFVVLDGDPLSVYTQVLETWVEGRRVFDRNDPRDRLYAEGGYGAGHDRRPYLCCAEQQ